MGWIKAQFEKQPFKLIGAFGIALLIIVAIVLLASGNYVISKFSVYPPEFVIEKITSTPTTTATPTITATPTTTSTPTPTSSPTPITPSPTATEDGSGTKDNAELVHVPAGNFIMGVDEGNENEKPAHTVYLDEFWIYKYEVTHSMYAEFLNEMGNQTEGGRFWLDVTYPGVHIRQIDGQWVTDDFSNHPVVKVSWYGANAYCSWAGGRLPTEAEWEKTARGETDNIYPWGNVIDCNKAQTNECNEYYILPVGTLPDGASPYGALDMAGNVWEWVADWYKLDYYLDSPLVNPQGPEPAFGRVIRGGSWFRSSIEATSVFRGREIPGGSTRDIGFRCVGSP